MLNNRISIGIEATDDSDVSPIVVIIVAIVVVFVVVFVVVRIQSDALFEQIAAKKRQNS